MVEKKLLLAFSALSRLTTISLWSKIEKKHPIIHCPTSEEVSEVSERVSAAEGEVSGPEKANE